MKRNAWILAAVGLLTVASQSCTKAIIDEKPTGNTGPVTYSDHIAPIMFNWCTTCHGGNSPSAGLLLTTYEQVRFQSESGNLVARVNNPTNPMPPAAQLSASDLDLINRWVEAGFPE